MVKGLVAFLHLVTAASAAFVLHDSRLAPPTGYVHEGAAPLDHNITFRIALAWGDAAGLEATLWNISHPASARYGQWLSAEELEAYVRPKTDTTKALTSFADSNGLQLSEASASGDLFAFTTTVARANALFRADLRHFTHVSSGATLARTLAYSLPSELVGHVQTIAPMTSFTLHNSRVTPVPAVPGLIAARGSKTAKACKEGSSITPTCLQELYGIPSTPIKTRKDNTVFITGYGNNWPQQSDLAAFLAAERPDISAKTGFNLISLNNGADPQGPGLAGVEPDLDIQVVTGLIGVPATFLSVGGASIAIEDLVVDSLDTTSYIASLSHPPSVLSNSYGWDEQDASAADNRQVCAGLMAVAARGVTFMDASGDGGVRGGHDQASQCGNNTFVPTFPSTCPYVTSVGGTAGLNPEHGTNFSSGGFSNVFPRPTYQNLAVPAFLKTLPGDFAGVFDSKGRGFPDLAAQAENFQIIINGSVVPVGGTSASAPVLAGVIALLNDQLLAAGRPTLGFLNPWLYLVAGPAGAFNDITIGTNRGFVCTANSSAAAFTARKGWDPVTGFGTPNWTKLLKAVGLN